MPNSTKNWLDCQREYQLAAREREIASPRTRRFWIFAKQRAKGSAGDSSGSATPTAKSDGNSNGE